MIFGRRKQETEDKLKAALEEVKIGQAELDKKQNEQIEALDELRNLLTSQEERLETLFKDNSKQLKRHSEAIEDMLDEGKAQEALSEQYESKIKEDAERENALLALVCCYQEQLSLIEEKLSTKDGWAEQMALFKRTLSTEFKQCAIEETGFVGETVDYRYHEILNVVDTEKEGLSNTIARTYRPGLIYHGKVLRKAQVMAYRERGNNE